MKKVTVTPQFKEAVLAQAKSMMTEGLSQKPFTTNHQQFQGLEIFLEEKPKKCFFNFEMTTEEGTKQIFVGSN